MLEIHPLSTLDAPELEPYRTMRRPQSHRERGIFVAEGEKVVRRLIESGLGIESLLLPQKWLDVYRPLLENRPDLIHVHVGPRELLERLTGFTYYQGVLAVGRVPEAVPLETALARKTSAPLLLLAADAVANAGNMGLLSRNAAAFGADALVTGETCCSPWIRWAVHGSMGTVFRLPVVESPCLAGAFETLRARGVRLVAAHPHSDRRTLDEADLGGSTCVVVGAEGTGIRPEILALCDEHVSIPMAEGVDSLNVGTCAGIFLYEAWRQRRAGRATR